MYIEQYGKQIEFSSTNVRDSFSTFSFKVFLNEVVIKRKKFKGLWFRCKVNGKSIANVYYKFSANNLIFLGFNINLSGKLRPKKIRRKLVAFLRNSKKDYLADFFEEMVD